MPIAAAIAHVRIKPVTRDTMVRMVISPADDQPWSSPTSPYHQCHLATKKLRMRVSEAQILLQNELRTSILPAASLSPLS